MSSIALRKNDSFLSYAEILRDLINNIPTRTLILKSFFVEL